MSEQLWSPLFEWRRQLRDISAADLMLLCGQPGPHGTTWTANVSAANVKLVGFVLSTYAGVELRAFPSVGVIARGCARDERTVQRALGALEVADFVQTVLGGGRKPNGRGRPSTYQLLHLGTYPGRVPEFDDILDRTGVRTPAAVRSTPAAVQTTPAAVSPTPAAVRSYPGTLPPEVVLEVEREIDREVVLEVGRPAGREDEEPVSVEMTSRKGETLELSAIDPELRRAYERVRVPQAAS